jgi:hypothetical protein
MNYDQRLCLGKDTLVYQNLFFTRGVDFCMAWLQNPKVLHFNPPMWGTKNFAWYLCLGGVTLLWA